MLRPSRAARARIRRCRSSGTRRSSCFTPAMISHHRRDISHGWLTGIRVMPTTIASPCDGRRDRSATHRPTPRLYGLCRPKPGARTLTVRLDRTPAGATNARARPHQGPTTAVAVFTRINNLRSRHVIAGKQERGGNHPAQLLILSRPCAADPQAPTRRVIPQKHLP
jgi:hypothetical protein